MSIVDFLLLALLAAAVLRGYRNGFTRQGPVLLLSLVGLYIGVRAGAYLQTSELSETAKLIASLIIIVAGMAIGSSVGEFIARKLTLRIRSAQTQLFDGVVGGTLGLASILVAIWLGATFLSLGPASSLQSKLRTSAIVRSLDSTFPPAATVFRDINTLLSGKDSPLIVIGNQASPKPDATLPDINSFDPYTAQAMTSTVKVEGLGCGGIIDGTGFVVASNHIVTNAHVVAGVRHPKVLTRNGTHNANLVWFDADRDLAVLEVEGLTEPPLTFASAAAQPTDSVLIIGYPRGGEQVTAPGIVLESVQALGKNIYGTGSVVRQVLSLQATVIQGNSGGPVINNKGQVVGVVFATSTTYNTIGYALDGPAIKDLVLKATTASRTLDTPACIPKGSE